MTEVILILGLPSLAVSFALLGYLYWSVKRTERLRDERPDRVVKCQ